MPWRCLQHGQWNTDFQYFDFCERDLKKVCLILLCTKYAYDFFKIIVRIITLLMKAGLFVFLQPALIISDIWLILNLLCLVLNSNWPKNYCVFKMSFYFLNNMDSCIKIFVVNHLKNPMKCRHAEWIKKMNIWIPGWTMGEGIKQGGELRRAAQEAILALFNLNTPQVTLRLSQLPKEYQVKLPIYWG